MSLPTRIRLANSTSRMALVLALPILLLILDIYSHPLLLSSTALTGAPNLTEILTQGAAPLGRFRAHQILASADAIDDPEYLSFLQGGPNALLISTFVDTEENRGNAGGSLQLAAGRRLKEVSPPDYVALQSILERLRGFYPGQVLTLPLSIPETRFRGFPLNYILVVALPIGHPESGDIRSGLSRAFRQADRLAIANIVVPALATRWQGKVDNGTLSPRELFDALFESIISGEHPEHIYISLYKNWPTLQLEDVAAALNEAWIKATEDETDPVPLYRAEMRLTLVFLVVCLINCGFLVRYTVRTFLIVAISFVGLAVGSKELLSFLVLNSGATYGFFIQIVLLGILALGFPAIVSWNPKDIFEQKPRGNGT